MNVERNVSKWQPFNAVISGDLMLKDVLNKKNVVKMPTLSEDQIAMLERKIFSSFTRQESIKVKFYRNGSLFELRGIVTNIDIIKHKVFINNERCLYFSQIVEIY